MENLFIILSFILQLSIIAWIIYTSIFTIKTKLKLRKEKNENDNI